MQLLYDAADLTITHDEAYGWLHITWREAHPGWTALPCCEEIWAQVRATGSTGILNDGTSDGDGWDEMVGWLVADFFPRLASSGVLAIAWVIPHNLPAHTTVNRVIRAVSAPSMVEFEDVASAYAWLCQMRRGMKG